MVKLIKDLKLKKVQAQIQDDQLRVSGPKRDDLQQVISMFKEKVTNLELQFVNFRE
jgi:cyclic-di-GMP-binding protein